MGWKMEALKRSLEKAQRHLEDKEYRDAEDVSRYLKKDCYRASFWTGLTADERKLVNDISDQADVVLKRAIALTKGEGEKS